MGVIVLTLMVALPLIGLCSLFLMLDKRTNPTPIPVKYDSRKGLR